MAGCRTAEVDHPPNPGPASGPGEVARASALEFLKALWRCGLERVDQVIGDLDLCERPLEPSAGDHVPLNQRDAERGRGPARIASESHELVPLAPQPGQQHAPHVPADAGHEDPHALVALGLLIAAAKAMRLASRPSDRARPGLRERGGCGALALAPGLWAASAARCGRGPHGFPRRGGGAPRVPFAGGTPVASLSSGLAGTRWA